MKYFSVVLASIVGITCFCGPSLTAQQSSDELGMERKLEYSQNILNGLVTENFDQIGKNARLMIELGNKNWVTEESMQYRTHNQLFLFTAASLVLAARDKNIDGATLFYTQMNTSCMNCHRTLRNE